MNRFEPEDDAYTPDVILEMAGFSPMNPKDPTKMVHIPIDSETTIHELFAPIFDFIIRDMGISENTVFSYLKLIAENSISSLDELDGVPDVVEGIDDEEYQEFKERMQNPKFLWYLHGLYKDDLEGR